MQNRRRGERKFGNGSNGTHPDGMTTRPIPLGELREDPIDLMAVQSDDELINALATGLAVSPPGVSGYDADDHVVAMLAAWRAEIDEEPVPELMDLDTAVVTVRSSRNRTRRRHLAPLAGAAALIIVAFGGVSIGAQAANPGDALWGVSKVLYSERAESVEAAAGVQGRLEEIRSALASGETALAAELLEMAQAEIPGVRSEEGLAQLAQEQERLAAKLEETPPGTPTDPDAPPTSRPADDQPADDERPSGEGSSDSGDTDARILEEPTDPTAPERTDPPSAPETATPEGAEEPSGTGTAEGSADPTTATGENVPSGTGTGSGTPSASGSGTGTPTASGSGAPTS